jgi:predicted membrane protein
MSTGDEGSNRFHRASILGGSDFTSVAGALETAKVTAIFSGVAVDLTGAELAPDGADLIIDSSLAGVAIAVPDSWNVSVVESQTIAGAVDIDTSDAANLPGDAPRLRVTIRARLSGVAIGAR